MACYIYGVIGLELATIFDVQRFSLHDGPGIRTTVFFKGCPLRCAWCQNPESQSHKPEIAFYDSRCQNELDCLRVCPRDAIAPVSDRRVVDANCDGCGLCAEACVHRALQRVGKSWSVDELLQELLADRDYFDSSGGGITLSGGEPLMHADFLALLLPKLKSSGLHITLETCGQFRFAQLEPLLPSLDLIYFDLKLFDDAEHQRYTGRSNKLIHQNFTQLVGCYDDLQARLPVVPGVTDSERNIRGIAGFLKSLGQRTIHCLPYHNLWEAKLKRLAGNRQPLSIPAQSTADLEAVRQLFADEGIDATTCD